MDMYDELAGVRAQLCEARADVERPSAGGWEHQRNAESRVARLLAYEADLEAQVAAEEAVVDRLAEEALASGHPLVWTVAYVATCLHVAA